MNDIAAVHVFQRVAHELRDAKSLANRQRVNALKVIPERLAVEVSATK